MEILELLAAVFGVISSLSFFLQAWKIENVHESKDVSLPMYVILFINAIIWLAYGLTTGNFAIMATFTITTLGTATIIFEYFRYGERIRKKSKT
jgi:uncharacterized protein with PQ loop repeat